MAGIVLLYFCGVLLGAAPVLGGTEYRLGGTDGNPWQAILAGKASIKLLLLTAKSSVKYRWGLRPLAREPIP